MGEFVTLETTDGIGTMRLNRPPMNALNTQLQEELRAAAHEATADEQVKAVIVYGGEKVFAAGAAGCVFDSWLGATLQERRWCSVCEHETERAVHDCGAVTVHRRGFAGVNNDAVNFLSTVAGGLLATFLAR